MGPESERARAQSSLVFRLGRVDGTGQVAQVTDTVTISLASTARETGSQGRTLGGGWTNGACIFKSSFWLLCELTIWANSGSKVTSQEVTALCR